MGEMRNAHTVLVGKPEGKITLKWILKEENGKVWNGIMWLRIGTGGELL
jgi:hypothetical protein